MKCRKLYSIFCTRSQTSHSWVSRSSKSWWVLCLCLCWLEILGGLICLSQACIIVLQDLLEKAEKQPNLTIGVVVSIVVVVLSVLFKIIFGGKKPVSIELWFYVTASLYLKGISGSVYALWHSRFINMVCRLEMLERKPRRMMVLNPRVTRETLRRKSRTRKSRTRMQVLPLEGGPDAITKTSRTNWHNITFFWVEFGFSCFWDLKFLLTKSPEFSTSRVMVRQLYEGVCVTIKLFSAVLLHFILRHVLYQILFEHKIVFVGFVFLV